MTFKLTGDLVGNLDQMDAKIKAATYAAAMYTATNAEGYMKQNAKWIDRTSAARNGLRAKVERSDTKVAIILYHSVPYGPYLEVRWSGKYAIIEPTMQYAGDMFAQVLGRMIFK